MVAFSVFTKSLGRLNQNIFVPFNQRGKIKRKAVAFVRLFSDSEPHIVKSSHPPLELPDLLFHEYVFENLHQWENKIAIECVESGKKVTYKDLYKCAKNLASSLQKKFKLNKGDRQFVLLPNCPEYPFIFMAGSMTGIITTSSNPLYTTYEISHQIEITESKIIFTAPEFHGNCIEALSKLKKEIPIVIVKSDPSSSIPPDTVDFFELVNSATPDSPDPVHLDMSSNVVLPFSSGTSGLPKGVELTHRNVTANLTQLKNGAYFKEKRDEETNQTVTLVILPMFHIYGMLAVTFDSLSTGERLVTLPRFEPKLLVDTIYKKKIGLLFLVPPLVFFLGRHPLVQEKHLQSVGCVVTGAAPCGSSDSEALKQKAPQILMCQGYGMTETSPVVTLTHWARTHKLESVGHPVSLTQIKIVDLETGKTLPRGSQGEICVKGPQVMKGYLNHPQATKESFDADGWLKTGDIGFCDNDGDLFVSDRIKELIKVKGFQVAPAEIEETLRNHPKVYDVGVIGVPHPTLGEAPKAFVTVKPGVSLTREEVMDFVKQHLSPHKQLKGGVAFIHAIPRSSAGKILRKKLLQLHQNSE